MKFSIPQKKQKGKHYTVEELYREYYPIMFVMLLKKKHQEADAKDIIHNVFLKIIMTWENINHDEIEQVLSRSLYQRVVDYYNENYSKDLTSDGADFMELVDLGLMKDPLRSIEREQFKQYFIQAIKNLSPAEKVVFAGFYFEGKSADQMKGVRSISTVLNLLARARNKVIEEMSETYVKE